MSEQVRLSPGPDAVFRQRRFLVESKKQQVSLGAVVAVLAVFGVIAAGVIMWFTDSGPIVRWKAGTYAMEIAAIDGDRGAAAVKLGDLGHDIALPYALKLLKSSEYTTRKYGYDIIDNIKAVSASEKVLAAILADDNATNRARGVFVLVHLCPEVKTHPKELAEYQAKYLSKIVKLLDDPSVEVQKAMCNAMGGFSGTYNPDHDIQWWKEWWKKNKPGAAEKAPEKATEPSK